MTDIDPAAQDRFQDRPLDVAEGAALLADLATALRRREQATAEAVTALVRLVGSGVCEHLEGLSLDQQLALTPGLVAADRGGLLSTAEVLPTLPKTLELFIAGKVSFGVLRRICTAARRVPLDRRAVLDERLAASATDPGLDVYGPDELCEQAEAACEELRDPRSVERREQRRSRGSFLALQSDLEGGLCGYFNLSPVDGATVLNGLAAHLHNNNNSEDGQSGDGPSHETSDDHGDGEASSQQGGVWCRRDRGGRQAAALVAMAEATLAGRDSKGRPRPARPLFVVSVDLRQATRTAAGWLGLDVPGPLPTLTARLVEGLNQDADIRAVIFDGHRPLAVSRKLKAQDVPADIRLAVAARDRGSRFPASRQPLGRSDLHHLVPRQQGGLNDVDNLAYVGEHEHHDNLHRRGWTGRHDPATGIITWTRQGRTLRTLPRGTPLARPPNTGPPRADPPGNAAPRTGPPGKGPPTAATDEGQPAVEPPHQPPPPGPPLLPF